MDKLALNNNLNFNLRNQPIKDILHTYITKVNSIPSLSQEEEIKFTNAYYINKEISAAKTLIESHLKLVIKIAMKYKNIGLSLIDLISQGNIGLMKAVDKFDPNKGFKLSTYATHWIKADIQEFILKSWSLVKIGTTALQKKLFYSIKKIKNQIIKLNGGIFNNSDYEEIASCVGATALEVKEIDLRISNTDVSLNVPIYNFANNTTSEAIDYLADNKPSPELALIVSYDKKKKYQLLKLALNLLNTREREVFIARKLLEEQKTLDELSKILRISKERVRQIEVTSFEKVKKFILNNKDKFNLFSQNIANSQLLLSV
ncbi:MAG: RNA polymerase factor sigma-32 [Rickettsiales bacterium]